MLTPQGNEYLPGLFYLREIDFPDVIPWRDWLPGVFYPREEWLAGVSYSGRLNDESPGNYIPGGDIEKFEKPREIWTKILNILTSWLVTQVDSIDKLKMEVKHLAIQSL